MMGTYDVAVLGLGAMGSAAAYELSRRGLKVVGFDRFVPPHTMGSTHGESRIIREAYWEDPAYVPCVRRAYELWWRLEGVTGRKMLQTTGGLFMGDPDAGPDGLVPGARRAAREHDIPTTDHTAAEIRKTFPQFRPADGMEGVYETRAGVLNPEKCVEAHLAYAQRYRADIRFEEQVLSWDTGAAGGVRVHTDKGSYDARRIVIAGGPWSVRLLSDLDVPLSVERQVQAWFTPAAHADRFSLEHCPLYAFEPGSGRLFYGFPDLGAGVKVAIHHEGDTVDPETVDRDVGDDDIARLRTLLAEYVPPLDTAPDRASVCLYTNTPDHRFVVDHHPDDDRIIIAAGFSGHGFKFASWVGEALADLAAGTPPKIDLGPFSVTRFLGGD